MIRVGRWLMILLVISGLGHVTSRQVTGQDPTVELAEAARMDKEWVALYRAGRYAEAIPLAERAVAIRERLFGAKDLRVATSLNDLANLHRLKGDYAGSEPLYLRALSIREEKLGTEGMDVAPSLSGLAVLYHTKGDYERAEPLYLRAIAILEKALGRDSIYVATEISNLADLYQLKADYARAEALLLRALEIKEKKLGREDERVAISLNNLASLYSDKGDDVSAEPLYKRALDIYEKALGPWHPEFAGALNNLASLYDDRNEYERARPLYQRALEILEKALGPEDERVAFSLNGLATGYRAKDDYAHAEPLYQRALEILEKALGADHPLVAIALGNLAVLYENQSDYARAEPLFQRALAIQQKAFGPEHPEVAIALGNLAALNIVKGDLVLAVQFEQRAQSVHEHNLRLILSTGSEGQKQRYLNTLNANTSGTVSLHARSAPGNQQAARLALTAILRRKGRALDAMTDQIAALRHRAAPGDLQLLDQLAAAQSQLAKLRLAGMSGNDSFTSEQQSAEDQRLTTEIEKLQSQISVRSTEFRVQTQPITIEAVQQALPADSALVELFSYEPFSLKKTEGKDRFGDARYVAYILKPKGDSAFVDLGPTEVINRAADQFLDAIRNAASVDAKETGRALDELVARPIRKLLGNTRNVLISPDGKLNLVPFAALVDEQGKYLVEDYSITYLTSGRDLLRLNVPRQSKQAPIVIANPDFSLAITSASPSPAATGATKPAPAPQPTPAANQTRGRRSGDLRKPNWNKLPGAAEEAEYLKRLLPNALVLTDKEATEGSLKQVVAPRILHLSTHGFFLPDQPTDPKNMKGVIAENPLLRSGLVLAGANNLQGGGDEDGILTALEAAGLNLWGTQLVVLSACETGVGDVRSGEGVYGLRRALVLAGTESQVMTLWKVDDTATSEVVIEYYRRLQAGQGRTEALRQVQLDFLKRKTRQHPFYWAGFILNGDWRSMRGKEIGQPKFIGPRPKKPVRHGIKRVG